MSDFKSVIHQGWHARKFDTASIDDCPYPQYSETAKDWRAGWNKANKDEPWSEPLRRKKVMVE